MFNFLGISAVNPLLLWGGLAVASPIIIHLLSRRRFRIVNWAAMDFLMSADRRNRKRIRLEHLILLLLRCLAILLLAMLVSRLFLSPSGLASMFAGAARTERIVLLDDSPSMQLSSANRSIFDRARDSLVDFTRTSAAERPGDTFTLLTTSRPDRPIVNGQYFEQSESIVNAIQPLEPGDRAASMDQALLAVERMIDEADAGGGAVNRVVYIVSDLRRRDWLASDATPEDRAVGKIIERIGEKSDGVVLVDLGEPPQPNLGITDVQPDQKTLVAGVATPLTVTVHNYGPMTARDVEVSLSVGDRAAMRRTIDAIDPQSKGTASFTVRFADAESNILRAEIEPDAMPADNARLYAAWVERGVEVLVVDGDPATRPFAAESYFFARAVDPPGTARSGNRADVVTESQFDGMDLDDYEVVVLCNVYQMPEGQRERLKAWVEAGGGLMVFLGDQVDASVYNEQLAPLGLIPGRLSRVASRGEDEWVNPVVVAADHPAMRIFAGQNNPLLSRAQVFRWWSVDLDADALDDGKARVVARFDDPDRSVFIAERSLGEGRSMLITSSADRDWTDWPAEPSYVVSMLESVSYLAPGSSSRGNVRVGEPLVYPLDLSRFKPEATIAPPEGEPQRVQASTGDGEADDAAESDDEPEGMVVEGAAANEDGGEPDDADADAGEGEDVEAPATASAEAGLAVRYAQTDKAGGYTIELTPHGEMEAEVIRFAANVDPAEGDLTPIERSALREQLGEANAEIVTGRDYLSAGAGGGRIELWQALAVALLIVLCAEQFLAWMFGQRR